MYGYEPFECPYNPGGGVLCERKKCTTCGWNPEVAQARLDAIIKKLEKEAKTE